MIHARQQIREAVAHLLDNLSTTGARAFSARAYPVNPGELPSILVLTPEENAEVDTIGPSVKMARTLSVVVVAIDAGTEIESRLDDMAREIETAIDAEFSGSGSRLGGLAKDMIYQGASVDVDASGAKRQGEIRMMYALSYRTARGAPQTAIA